MRITFSKKADNDIQDIYEYLYYGFGQRTADEKVNQTGGGIIGIICT